MSKRRMKLINGSMYEYEIYDLVDYTDPVLKQVTPILDVNNPPFNLAYVSNSLIFTMIEHNGVGLAAPQVGLPYRMFAMAEGEKAICCINPEVLNVEGEDLFGEGCLSFPGLFLKINRPAKIKARFTDIDGNVVTKEYTGLTARTFLHESDHLDGIVYTSKVSKLKLDMARGKMKSNVKKLKKQQDARHEALAIMNMIKAQQPVKPQEPQKNQLIMKI